MIIMYTLYIYIIEVPSNDDLNILYIYIYIYLYWVFYSIIYIINNNFNYISGKLPEILVGIPH